MRCTLHLFAQLAEAAGTRRLELDLAPSATVATLWTALERSHPDAARAIEPWRDRLAVARNLRYAAAEERLEDGDEIAFIPPVSGG